MTGAATEWSTLRVPDALQPLTNAAAPWVLVAFAVALCARWSGEALVLAVTVFVAEVLAFYLGEALRGWTVSGHQLAFWSVCSLIVGPVVGLAAGWLRHSGRREAALGAGIVGGLLVGEAVNGLTALRFSSPAGWWQIQIVVGLALALVPVLWRTRGPWRTRGHRLAGALVIAVSLAACAVVGLVTLAVYRVP